MFAPNRLLALLLFLALIPTVSVADEPVVSPEQKKMMEAFVKASTPGDAHDFLQRYEGDWNYTMKFWMQPDAKPEESSGKAKFSMILGGRFLQQEFEGTSMGQPFSGLGFTGYDTLKEKFISTWMDNMGTTMVNSDGQFVDGKGAIEESGSHSCPMEEDGVAEFRNVWTAPKDGAFSFEWYRKLPDGKEFKGMEIHYKKAAK